MSDINNIEELEARLKKNPQSLLFARLAELYIKVKRVDDAIALCKKGIKHHPQYITGNFILGKAFIAKKEYDKAENEIKTVLSYDQRHLGAHKLLGDLMRKLGYENRAIMHYRDILYIDPFEMKMRQLLSTLYGEDMDTLDDKSSTAGPVTNETELDRELLVERESFQASLTGDQPTEKDKIEDFEPFTDESSLSEDSVLEKTETDESEPAEILDEAFSFSDEEPEETIDAASPALDEQETDTIPEMVEFIDEQSSETAESDEINTIEPENAESDITAFSEDEIPTDAGEIEQDEAGQPESGIEIEKQTAPSEPEFSETDRMTEQEAGSDLLISDTMQEPDDELLFEPDTTDSSTVETSDQLTQSEDTGDDEDDLMVQLDEIFPDEDSAVQPEIDSETVEETPDKQGEVEPAPPLSQDIKEKTDLDLLDEEFVLETGEPDSISDMSESTERIDVESDSEITAEPDSESMSPAENEFRPLLETEEESSMDLETSYKEENLSGISSNMDTSHILIPEDEAFSPSEEPETDNTDKDIDSEQNAAEQSDDEADAFTFIPLGEENTEEPESRLESPETMDESKTLPESDSSAQTDTMDMDLQITEDINHPDGSPQSEEKSTPDDTVQSDESPLEPVTEEGSPPALEEFQGIPPIEIPEKSDESPPAAEPEEKPKAEEPEDQKAKTSAESGSKTASGKMVSPTLAEIYSAQGQYEKAIKVYETLLEKNPDETKYQDKIKELNDKLKSS